MAGGAAGQRGGCRGSGGGCNWWGGLRGERRRAAQRLRACDAGVDSTRGQFNKSTCSVQKTQLSTFAVHNACVVRVRDVMWVPTNEQCLSQTAARAPRAKPGAKYCAPVVEALVRSLVITQIQKLFFEI